MTTPPRTAPGSDRPLTAEDVLADVWRSVAIIEVLADQRRAQARDPVRRAFGLLPDLSQGDIAALRAAARAHARRMRSPALRPVPAGPGQPTPFLQNEPGGEGVRPSRPPRRRNQKAPARPGDGTRSAGWNEPGTMQRHESGTTQRRPPVPPAAQQGVQPPAKPIPVNPEEDARLKRMPEDPDPGAWTPPEPSQTRFLGGVPVHDIERTPLIKPAWWDERDDPDWKG
ncbi:hypothetical protein [Alsobacter sp. R-9]